MQGTQQRGARGAVPHGPCDDLSLQGPSFKNGRYPDGVQGSRACSVNRCNTENNTFVLG